MPRFRAKILVLGLLLLLLISACLPLQQYRSPNENSVQPAVKKVSLAYIEFDDQGELWDRKQLVTAVQLINKAKKLSCSGSDPASEESKECKDGPIVIIFVHGWNNDVSPAQMGNPRSTIHRFRGFLENSVLKIPIHDNRDIPILGIYLGWRGRNTSIPGISFWNRRKAAERIAGAGLTEALLRLIDEGKIPIPNKRYPDDETTVVVIAHSFGALMVERALFGVLTRDVMKKQHPSADLAVLINSAANSVESKKFIDFFLDPNTEYTPYNGQLPVDLGYTPPLVYSVTGGADIATRAIFPIGMWFKTLGIKLRRGKLQGIGESQRHLFTHTPGNTRSLVSHRVWKARGSEPLRDRSTIYHTTHKNEDLFAFTLDELADGTHPPGKEDTFNVCMRRGSDRFNQTPYWIIRVPRQIIGSHSDIFNNNMTNFLIKLYKISRPLKDKCRNSWVVKDDDIARAQCGPQERQ